MGNQIKNNVGIPPELKKIIVMPAQADTAGAATLATLIADHNLLLAKLRAAGLMLD